MSTDCTFLHTFLNRLLLQPPPARPDVRARRQAAVLVAVTDAESLILTRRATHLRHHPGQIAFPGGRIETTDASPIAAALRESEEEIGLAPAQVTVLATLPPLGTISDFHVTPVLGRIRADVTLRANPQEVTEILTVPLAVVLRRAHYRTLTVLRHGRPQPIRFCWYRQTLIWGMTAAVLYDLACLADPPASPADFSPRLTLSSG